MESRKTGIAILALLATVTLAGAALGWQIRLQSRLPEHKLASPDTRPVSENAEQPGTTSSAQR